MIKYAWENIILHLLYKIFSNTNKSNQCSLQWLIMIIVIIASLLFLVSCSAQEDTPAVPGHGITGQNDEISEAEAKSEAPGELVNSEDDPYPGQAEEKGPVEPVTVPKVALYSGSGSWAENVNILKEFFDSYAIEYVLVDEQYVIEPGLNEQTEIIIFPGGGAADYRYEISNHDSIRNFVENGGLFIGFCAGAYYAADIFIWEGTEYNYPLELFSGSSVGPLTGQIGWGEQALLKLNPDHPANESFDHELDIYYFDGPYFIPHDSDEVDAGTIKILAHYDVNDQPAVIAGRFGEGGYLLFGPHPEMDDHEKGEGTNWPWLYSSLLWFANW